VVVRLAFLLLALLTGGAAVAQTYRAVGAEPMWSVTITPSHILFRNIDFRLESFRTPPRRPIRNGYVYATPRYRFEIVHRRCDEVMNGFDYVDTFRIAFAHGGTYYVGCGGAVLPPPRLADTDWHIRAIDGAAVPRDDHLLSFREGRIEIRSGCNNFAGSFTERGRSLRAQAVVATRPDCDAPLMAYDTKLLRLLGAPTRFRFPRDGRTMELSGSGITARFERM
jgi:heat shock protein HslJ